MLVLLTGMLVTSCTMSMTNVSTNGKSSDVIDEEQSASPTVSPTLSLPIKPI